MVKSPLQNTEQTHNLATENKCFETVVKLKYFGRKVNVKVKLSLCFNWAPRHEGGLGERRYNSTHSLTSALDGVEWSTLRPGRFTPGKEPLVPIGKEAGWVPEPFWTQWREKFPAPAGNRTLSKLHSRRNYEKIKCEEFLLPFSSQSSVLPPSR
jgi:hypothetical protein